MKRLALTAALLALAAAPMSAQTPQPGKSADHKMMATDDYRKAMQDMQKAMMAANDADPDRAFALKMIEHHKGAVAMGEALLKHGDDAEAKKMAQMTIDMQKKDIADLQGWLDRHGGRMPKS